MVAAQGLRIQIAVPGSLFKDITSWINLSFYSLSNTLQGFPGVWKEGVFLRKRRCGPIPPCISCGLAGARPQNAFWSRRAARSNRVFAQAAMQRRTAWGRAAPQGGDRQTGERKRGAKPGMALAGRRAARPVAVAAGRSGAPGSARSGRRRRGAFARKPGNAMGSFPGKGRSTPQRV